MTCSMCGAPLSPWQAYQRVRGWEKPRQRRGSGSSIVLREKVEEFACGACISQLQAGAQVRQETLL